jgi:hypothetical protein
VTFVPNLSQGVESGVERAILVDMETITTYAVTFKQAGRVLRVSVPAASRMEAMLEVQRGNRARFIIAAQGVR